MREEHRLWVFDSRTQRKKFGSKKYEVTVECRRLQNEGLHDLDSSPNIFRVLKEEIGKACGTYGEERCIQSFCRET